MVTPIIHRVTVERRGSGIEDESAYHCTGLRATGGPLDVMSHCHNESCGLDEGRFSRVKSVIFWNELQRSLLKSSYKETFKSKFKLGAFISQVKQPDW